MTTFESAIRNAVDRAWRDHEDRLHIAAFEHPHTAVKLLAGLAIDQEAAVLRQNQPQDAPEASEGVIVAPDWEKLAKTQAAAIDEACYWLVRGNPQKALTLLEALEE